MVSKKLGLGSRWEVVEPNGKSGENLVGCEEDLVVFQIKKHDFCVEVNIEEQETKKEDVGYLCLCKYR